MSHPEQYVALALQPGFDFVRDRAQIMGNIQRIAGLMQAGAWLAGCQMPVRLITIPEGALQGFWDELDDMRHSDYLESIAIDVPGPETEAIGELARKHDAYIVFQARAKDPNIPGYYFNNAFIISPEGEVIHRYAKLQVYVQEPSATPLDVYDRWSEVYGWTLESLFPVADTEIGRIGTMVCYDGAFPEIARGLAANGAEIIYRCAYGEPFVSQGQWEIENRARALDNNCYVIAPNVGEAHVIPEVNYPVRVGGSSMIVDPYGNVIAKSESTSTAYTGAVMDIGSLRQARARMGTLPTLKELSMEQYRVIYEQPVRPRNFLHDDPNKHHADRREQLEKARRGLVERGVWPEYEPAVTHAGS